MQVRLTDAIGPAFYDVHHDVKTGAHTYYYLDGGRGSLKSSFASLEIVLGLIRDKKASAICFRKVGNTLRESVFEQIGWAIEKLGLDGDFKKSTSPLRYTRKGTGQVISFRGLDDPRKLKSIKCPGGCYWAFCWFEELDEYSGPEEIRSVCQSVLRGGDRVVVFMTFNPPVSSSNWANEAAVVSEQDPESYHKKTTYLQAPSEWLGPVFIHDAELLKATNERAYRHEYLGEAVGTGRQIFPLVEIRKITEEEIKTMGSFYTGVDFGWYPDPVAMVRVSYSPAQRKIYILDELYGNFISNASLAEEIKKRGYNDVRVICDSAEPKSVQDLRDTGVRAEGAVKGPGSVEYSMKWLQNRTIVIDPQRTPNTFREITHYEHDVRPDGAIISGYPDRDNHSIDALRYSLNSVIMRRGELA